MTIGSITDDIATMTARLHQQRLTSANPATRARAMAVEAARLKVEPVKVEPVPKRKRIHKPTLASVAKQAIKAGLEVARYDIDPATGKISIIPGKPEPATTITIPQIDASEWN